MKTYFNMKTSYGTETVDELDSSDFPSVQEFRKARRELLKDYQMCMGEVYTSKRCTNDWRNS